MQEQRAAREDSPAAATTRGTPPRLSCETRILGGRYRVRRIIGRGEVADVYLGDDLLLDRAIALVISHEDPNADGTRLDQFRRKAISLAAVRSPHVASIYDFGVAHEGAYLVMQHNEGRTVQEEIRRFGPMTDTRAAATLNQLLAGLAAMHARGLVHGDIRSSNVLLARTGKVVLMDRGIVLDTRPSQPILVGDGRPSPRPREAMPARTLTCDVYDVGLLMLFMLTGVDPSRRSQRLGFEDLYRQLPVPFAGLARRSLDTDPAERFASAAVMKTAVEAALTTATSSGSRSDPERAPSASRTTQSSRPTTPMAAVQLITLLADATREDRESRPTTRMTAGDLLSLLDDAPPPHRDPR